MDCLAHRCGENSEKRRASVPRAMEILEEEVAEYQSECMRRAAAPAIEAMVKHGERVKDQNLEWASEKLAHLSEKDLRVVEDLATRMVRGFIQTPIRELKEELTGGHYRDTVLKLFPDDAGGN